MNGFLLINKPPGITSFEAVRRVKKLSKEKKVGHMGTLDPRACGLLIIGLGKYVRLEEYLLKLPKTYIVEVLFGVSSDTYDRESHRFFYDKEGKTVNIEILEETLKKHFTGEIEQTPPPYSAVHIEGERAYNLARKNISVSLPKRKVTIYESEVLNFDKTRNTALIRFKVSSGTYIRSLVHDIGEKLNTKTLVSFLVRTDIGHLSVNDSIPFNKIKEGITKKLLSPLEVLDFPVYKTSEEEEKKILNGNAIEARFSTIESPYISIINSQGRFIAVGKVSGNIIKPDKVFPQNEV
ncbi:tRNA pseudouridine(55) synthase TruB [Dictyoglomus thermophilum]|uniref:tRNA pseudouridine(55) synthase TruB n=1 Tax=Dictyoglomus thermophilum TaxID=14 RepID=UPI0011EB53A4|nr:tRNA pseudouridine(55) synthase TruB [Dictyoglomus thermophilum]TYT22537.1 tRNA pseudouridine(55) synthase TruB [Dictyoglomus thermophilum]